MKQTIREQIKEFYKENGITLSLEACDKFNELAKRNRADKTLFDYTIFKAIAIEEGVFKLNKDITKKQIRNSKDFTLCLDNIEKEPSEWKEFKNGLIKLLREVFLWSAMVCDDVESGDKEYV